MNNLPAKTSPDSGHSDRSDAWDLAWRLDQAARPAMAAPDSSAGYGTPHTPGLIRGFDPSVRPGDIRLLSPALAPSPDRPVYAAILDSGLDADGLMAMPFSPFDQPANSFELETGVGDGPLAVLQAWNAVVMPKPLLARSWLAAKLPESVLAESAELSRCYRIGAAIPPELDERVGPPSDDCSDLRQDYLDEEGMIAVGLDHAAAEFDAWLEQVRLLAADSAAFESIVLPAAADSGGEPLSRVCMTPDSSSRGFTAKNLLPGNDRPGYSGPAHWELADGCAADAGAFVSVVANGGIIGSGTVAEEAGRLLVIAEVSAPEGCAISDTSLIIGN